MMDDWMWMGFGFGYGVAHWIIFAIFVAVILYPVGRILNRIGFSPLWSVLVFVPLANLLALWVLAFSDWPRDREQRN
jgi:predicted PurR-regulated permease PerM